MHLIWWHHHEQAATCLCRVALCKPEIKNALIDLFHAVNYWQMRDLHVDVSFLSRAKILSVTSDPEARNVRCSMCTVFAHEICSIFIETCHGFYSHVVPFLCFMSIQNITTLFPFFVLLNEPFMEVDSNLCAQWLGKHEFVTWLPLINLDIVLVLAHDDGRAANHGPRIHDALSASDHGLRLDCTIIEASHHFTCDDLPFLFCHLQRNTEDHENVVDSINAHGIYIRDDVCAGQSALNVRIFNEWIEKVSR